MSKKTSKSAKSPKTLISIIITTQSLLIIGLSLVAGLGMTTASYNFWPKKSNTVTACASENINTVKYGRPFWVYRQAFVSNNEPYGIKGSNCLDASICNGASAVCDMGPSYDIPPPYEWRIGFAIADLVIWTLISWPIIYGLGKVRRRYG
jgi:hypothetical protein